MNYESPEGRIQRLEEQVAALVRIVKLITNFSRDDHKNILRVIAVLADQDRNLVTTDLLNLKTVFEHSKGFDEPFRQTMLKTIAERQQQLASSPSPMEEFNKISWPVLPEDLFGLDQQWPPKNPPGA